jgi:hypothetical protein
MSRSIGDREASSDPIVDVLISGCCGCWMDGKRGARSIRDWIRGEMPEMDLGGDPDLDDVHIPVSLNQTVVRMISVFRLEGILLNIQKCKTLLSVTCG